VSHVQELVTPEELGIGIRSGPEMFFIGSQLHINQEKQGDKNHVGISLDVKNAHNAYERAKANLTAQQAAQTNPNLKPFAIGLDAVKIVKSDIYMRSNKHVWGFQRLCRSEAGDGQGNALTGVTNALLIHGPPKKISASHNGIVVRDIHDDILLSGTPDDIFGIDGGKGALQRLLEDLAELNLSPNNSKLQGYGANESSRCLIPSWIKQPKIFKMNEQTGEDIPYFGLNLCGAAIGDGEYAKQHNVATIATICTNITNTSRKLGDVSAHAAHAANTYSLSARANYVFSTNSSNTLPSKSME
jgi:hypothetical protein